MSNGNVFRLGAEGIDVGVVSRGNIFSIISGECFPCISKYSYIDCYFIVGRPFSVDSINI